MVRFSSGCREEKGRGKGLEGVSYREVKEAGAAHGCVFFGSSYKIGGAVAEVVVQLPVKGGVPETQAAYGGKFMDYLGPRG